MECRLRLSTRNGYLSVKQQLHKRGWTTAVSVKIPTAAVKKGPRPSSKLSLGRKGHACTSVRSSCSPVLTQNSGFILTNHSIQQPISVYRQKTRCICTTLWQTILMCPSPNPSPLSHPYVKRAVVEEQSPRLDLALIHTVLPVPSFVDLLYPITDVLKGVTNNPGDGFRRYTPVDCERFDGFHDHRGGLDSGALQNT